MIRSPKLFPLLVGSMALRRRRDYFIKPLPFVVGLELLFFALEGALFGDHHQPHMKLAIINFVTIAPFLAFAFAIVTRLDQVQTKLAELATTDVLTGLPNRRAFMERSSIANTAARKGMIVIVDADYFKAINDTHGHAVGDLCLKAIARQLREVTRDSDIIGRLGGEEFGIYFPSTAPAEAQAIGKKLTEAIHVDPLEVGASVSVTLSLGAAPTTPAEGIEFFLNRADEALYIAKKTGRARLVVWDGTEESQVA